MKRIRWFLKMCGMCTSMCWRAYLSYLGWSALVHGIGLIVGYLAEYTVIYAMVSNFSSIGGFSAPEVCFLFAMGLTAYALGNVHTREFWRFDDLVQRGRLDQFLVRPVSPLLQLFCWDIQVGYISHVVLGLGSMLVLKASLGLRWGIGQWLVLLLSLVSGTLVMSGIALIATPLTFWWGRSGKVAGFLRWQLRQTITYPISIYPSWIQHALLVIPYAFVNYYPCAYLFGKPTNIPAVWIPFASLAAGVLINLLFWVFWRRGLRRYNSAGG